MTTSFFPFLSPSHRIVNALELQDYLKKPTRKLPAGITRKVLFFFFPFLIFPIMSTVMFIAWMKNVLWEQWDLPVLPTTWERITLHLPSLSPINQKFDVHKECSAACSSLKTQCWGCKRSDPNPSPCHSCALLSACWATLQSCCWMSHRLAWTPMDSAAFGEQDPRLLG